ncbi:alkaline phosphatase [Pseudonocardiaceae bacterium YIM PH 21723]|nr:alkaline phosphatase [Pseudonocardiaceae bacterium YIM PH 21723]
MVMSAATLLGIAVLAMPAVAADGNPWDQRPDHTETVADAIDGGMARNVILLIGDGMGDSEITIARNYEKGAAGRLAMDEFPLTGAYTTYSVEKGDATKPVYVPDSAATATAWSTGSKSYNGAIGVDANGKPKPALLELARKQGYRTGNVTTAEVQDATPGAGGGAHVVDRSCKGPESMAACAQNDKVNGGAGSIAEQFLDTKADVILGGGKQYFDQKTQAGPAKGKTVLEQAQGAGYQLVTDKDGLAKADENKPLLGLFAKNDMTVQWTGPLAVKGGTQPQECTANPELPAAAPQLVDMQRKALSVLNKGKKSAGFFLQVEGASIDKQDHKGDPCGQIGETVAFDKAVGEAIDFAKKDGNTLVIVTADHAHASQIVPKPVSLGRTATLITKEKRPLTISYASGATEDYMEHTGTQLRIAAMGPQAANVSGRIDQTDVFYIISRALHLK